MRGLFMEAIKTYSRNPVGREHKLTIDCPVCGSLKCRSKYSLGSSMYVRCEECYLVYQNPQPAFESIRERYDGKYFDYEIDNEKAFGSLLLKSLDDIKFTGSTPEGNKMSILEIGCATGWFLEKMKARDHVVQGVEICDASAEYGRKHRGLSISGETLEDSHFEDGSFDTALASHVIEHLNDPMSFLAECYRVIKPGGRIILITPAIDGFQAALFGRRWRSLIEDHLVLFSKKTLKKALYNSGFRVRTVKSWGGLAAGTAWKPVKAAADRLAKGLNAGDVMIVDAVKPG